MIWLKTFKALFTSIYILQAWMKDNYMCWNCLFTQMLSIWVSCSKRMTSFVCLVGGGGLSYEFTLCLLWSSNRDEIKSGIPSAQSVWQACLCFRKRVFVYLCVCVCVCVCVRERGREAERAREKKRNIWYFTWWPHTYPSPSSRSSWRGEAATQADQTHSSSSLPGSWFACTRFPKRERERERNEVMRE